MGGGLGARGIAYLVCLIELHGLLLLGLPPFSACGSSMSAGSCSLIEQGPFYSEIRIMWGYLLGTLFVLWLLVFCESSLAKVPSQRHVICKGAACAYQLSDSSSASRRPLHHDSQTTSGGLARPINFFFLKTRPIILRSTAACHLSDLFYKPMVLYYGASSSIQSNQSLVFKHRQLNLLQFCLFHESWILSATRQVQCHCPT